MNNSNVLPVPVFLPVLEEEEDLLLKPFDVFRYHYESNCRALAGADIIANN